MGEGAKERKKILVVEDDPHMQEGLRMSIERWGHQVEVAADVPIAVRKLSLRPYDLIVTDLRMPNGSGLEVIKEAKRVSPHTPVIVITAYGTVEKAVEAMKVGAVDFIQKPFSMEDLRETLERCFRAMGGPGCALEEGTGKGILSKDPSFLLILQRARAIANTKVPVLIQGESGTGKELLARFIHSQSPRCTKPLVAVNCAAIPENLLESELFGHEKGAFTGAVARKIGKFEQAHGGTLLLDEIGEMPLSLQAKLLRVLQEWEIDRVGGTAPVVVDVRVIATTNADLVESVRKGKFREDLFFRLSVMPFRLPPLRERKGDLELLVDHFLKEACREYGKSIEGLSQEAWEMLRNHSWPGNVRELRNVIQRAVLLCSERLISPKDVWIESIHSSLEDFTLPCASIKDVERELILRTLEREGWNRTRASAKLGISIRTLRNKLHEYRKEGFIDRTLGGAR